MKETLIILSVFAGIVAMVFLMPWAIAAFGISFREAQSWDCENRGMELVDVWSADFQAYVPRCEMKVSTP